MSSLDTFQGLIDQLKLDGRYRTFIDLERVVGNHRSGPMAGETANFRLVPLARGRERADVFHNI